MVQTAGHFHSSYLARRGRLLACLALGICTALAPTLPAQSTSATLSGTIFDPSGKVIPAADLIATNVGTSVVTRAVANGEGLYLFGALEPGSYRLTINKQGFKTITVTDLLLQVAGAATRNFQLELGATSETITVEDNRLNINFVDATVSTVIDREFVDSVPLNGRSLQSLILLTPGVSPTNPGPAQVIGNGFTVNGNRDTASANWTVDGVSANVHTGSAPGSPDYLASGATVLGTTQSLISIDALQEFRVSTSSSGPEYGIAPGAQIQFQSRAGTSRFHGTAYDYLRNNIFDANDWFANSKNIALPAERQNDFGGTFAGPVLIPHVYNGKNKAFFFFNYEGLRLLQPTILINNPSPTAEYRASAPAALQPLLNALPLPNGRLYGNGWGDWSSGFSNPSHVDTLSLRMDYSVNDRNKFFARVSNSPSRAGAYGNASLSNSEIQILTATAGLTTILSPAIVNELRANFTRNASTSALDPLPSINGSDPSGVAAALAPPAQFANGFGQIVTFRDTSFSTAASIYSLTSGTWLHQWNIVDGLKWQRGRHQFRAGFEWNRHSSAQAPIAYQTQFLFANLAAIASSTPTQAVILAQPNEIRSIVVRSGFYIADNWKVNRRLSLDLGLRWELTFPPHYGSGFTPLQATDISDLAHPVYEEKNQLYNMSWRNIAPRIGIAYQLRDAGNFQTVLRMGGGLFYSTETPTNFVSGGFPYSAQTVLPAGTKFPLPASLFTPPPVSGNYTAAQLASQVLVGVDPNLDLPRIWQWNFTLEQQLGRNQSLSAAYVASAGRRLYTSAVYYPAGARSISYSTNGTASDYDSLQVKFNQRLTRGLRSLVSYTWSHALDNNSANNYTYAPVRGNSSFDIRHQLSIATVCTIPGARGNRILKSATSGWEFSDNFNVHTGTPVLMQAGFFPSIIGNNNPFVFPQVVPGVPAYLYGPQYPGGARLNPAAFRVPLSGETGNSGRNQFRNQGFWQLDASIQRRVVLSEKFGALRFRVDAFNVFNHPNFGPYVASITGTTPSAATFGLPTKMVNQQNAAFTSALYGTGGPRSLQFSIRYEF